MREVVVIGGGPGGATAALLLARAGHDVLLLERERFPRFHIGESLLPIDLPLFERLGLDPAVGGHQFKRGAEFIDEHNDEFAFYSFADALPGTPHHAWQVERAHFDAQLLELARAAGVEVRQGVEVQRVESLPCRARGVRTRRATASTRRGGTPCWGGRRVSSSPSTASGARLPSPTSPGFRRRWPTIWPRTATSRSS